MELGTFQELRWWCSWIDSWDLSSKWKVLEFTWFPEKYWNQFLMVNQPFPNNSKWYLWILLFRHILLFLQRRQGRGSSFKWGLVLFETSKSHDRFTLFSFYFPCASILTYIDICYTNLGTSLSKTIVPTPGLYKTHKVLLRGLVTCDIKINEQWRSVEQQLFSHQHSVLGLVHEGKMFTWLFSIATKKLNTEVICERC